MGWFKCPLRQVKKLEVKNVLLEANIQNLTEALDLQAEQIKGFEATIARLNNKDKKCVKNCKPKNKKNKAVSKDTVASGKGKAKPTATNAKKSSAKKDSK